MLLACVHPTNDSNFSGSLIEHYYLSPLQSLMKLLSHVSARARMALHMNIPTLQYLFISILKSITRPKFNRFSTYLIDLKAFKKAHRSSQNTCSSVLLNHYKNYY